MLTLATERRLLQIAITLACLVPLSAGLGGMVLGVAFLDGGSSAMDSHFRYLSGLLFAIGLAFLLTVPHIERKTGRIRMLTVLVFTGGAGRLIGCILNGMPNHFMLAALGMELVVTPLLCLWQSRVAKRFVIMA